MDKLAAIDAGYRELGAQRLRLAAQAVRSGVPMRQVSQYVPKRTVERVLADKPTVGLGTYVPAVVRDKDRETT